MPSIPHWTDFAERISTAETVLVIANLILLLASRSLTDWLSKVGPRGGSQSPASVQLLRFFQSVNVIIFGVVIIRVLLLPEAIQAWTTRPLSVMVVVYVGYLTLHALRRQIHRRFGKERQADGATHFQETYQSRMLSLLVGALVVSLCIIASVRILGFESLLEAGGVLGFIGVLAALTQGAWAPDIIAGLIILNSTLFEEGDVVEFDRGPGGVLGVIFKTKLFHTEILNLTNNHRVMLPNSVLRNAVVHNLSKFASARGLRERLVFNIGYDVTPEQVRRMFNSAFETASQNPSIRLETQHPIEVRVMDTGDDAVLWAVYYYTKHVNDLLQTRYLFRESILDASIEHKIALRTPRLVEPVGQERPGLLENMAGNA
jgi:small-conductance mechanosensitive channel